MAEKIGESLLTALEERPVSISVIPKKEGGTTTTSNGSSNYPKNVLLPGTDAKSKAAQQEEVTQRFQDFGLGRGVDASRAKPWLIKTSFQVRPLGFGKLIGTEQGGTVEAYEDVVKSVRELQFELQQSISAPNVPVNIGADADHFRSATNKRRVVGRRVHNRTISFREEFDDMPVKVGRVQPSTPVREVSEGGEDPVEEDVAHSDEVGKDPTFEERVAKWVLEELHPEWEGDRSAIAVFKEWFENQSDATLIDIYKMCLEFVRTFQVTHYVSSVDLGALEYSVITKEEYVREMGLTGSLGLEDVVAAVLKTKGKYTSKKKHKSSHIKKVGLIRNPDKGNYYVERGTYAEAVIGVDVKPIQVLVRHQGLRRVLAHAVTHYIEDQRDTSVGPFFIISDSIDRKTVYLSVNEEDMSLSATDKKGVSLSATDKKGEASEFFIHMTDEGRSVNEFHIVYEGKAGPLEEYQPPTLTFGGSTRGATERPPPHHYLSTPLYAFGSNSGPLHFELNPKKSHTMFVLHNRLRTWRAPAETVTPWLQGREECYINCYSRKFARDGYLAVRRELEAGTVRYRPVCVPSRRPSEDYFKVFSLLFVPTKRQLPTASDLKSSPLPLRTKPQKVVSSRYTKDGVEMQSPV